MNLVYVTHYPAWFFGQTGVIELQLSINRSTNSDNLRFSLKLAMNLAYDTHCLLGSLKDQSDWTTLNSDNLRFTLKLAMNLVYVTYYLSRFFEQTRVIELQLRINRSTNSDNLRFSLKLAMNLAYGTHYFSWFFEQPRVSTLL